MLNWWLNRFWLGLWNTRNLPRQFPHDFLQITPNFQIFWPFDLVTLDNILRATRKLANILFPAPNTRLKKDLKVTPLSFYLLFKEPLKVRNVNKLALKCCVWGWKALFKVFVAFVWLWKCEKMSFFLSSRGHTTFQ